MNSPWFEYKGCDFSLKGMSGKDKRDNGLTKDGSGRVGIYKATGCSHCYTLECNYNEGLATNFIPNCTNVLLPPPQSLPSASGESPQYPPLLTNTKTPVNYSKYVRALFARAQKRASGRGAPTAALTNDRRRQPAPTSDANDRSLAPQPPSLALAERAGGAGERANDRHQRAGGASQQPPLLALASLSRCASLACAQPPSLALDPPPPP
jgi:hypothetical protein